jgi:hypothetical protein
MIEIVSGFNPLAQDVWYGIKQSNGEVRTRFANHANAANAAAAWSRETGLSVNDCSDRGTGVLRRLRTGR